VRYYWEEAQRRKRQLELPWRMRAIFAVRGLFLSKERREAFQKIAGYVMMEPKGPE
jgi:hydrogenase-4 membrane subunit HyfE